MRQADAVTKIARELPDDWERVVYPDHPLLLKSPTFLANSNNRLHAIFIYAGGSPHPLRSPEFARVLLARLALPARTVFHCYTDEQHQIQPIADTLFDITAPLEKSAYCIDTEVGVSERSVSMIEALQRANNMRFSELQQWPDSVDFMDDDPRSKDYPDFQRGNTGLVTETRTPSRTFGDELRPPRSMRCKDDRLIELDGNRTPPTASLDRLLRAAVIADYSTSMATLYDTASILKGNPRLLPRRYLTWGLALSNNTLDPAKNLRAAQFAGIATGAVDNGAK